jgi:glycolate oxidase
MDRAFLDELRQIVGDEALLQDPLELLTYECDALPHLRESPAAVVLPASASQIQGVVRLCARHGVPFVPRGHGTGLSGGALPVAGGVVIALSRLNRVLDVDIPNQRVTVEPGVTNLEITRQVAPFGFYYAPDPSSQQVCSIGGNVAENSGGAHCLKYGFTVHHVLEVEAVMPDGEIVHFGSTFADTPGPDLLGLLVGSEGTIAIATRITVRILRRPETVQTLLAAFATIDAGGAVVSDIIAAGIIPAAVEMMDALAIRAAEAAVVRVIAKLYPAAQRLGPDSRLANWLGVQVGGCDGCRGPRGGVIVIIEAPSRALNARRCIMRRPQTLGDLLDEAHVIAAHDFILARSNGRRWS